MKWKTLILGLFAATFWSTASSTLQGQSCPGAGSLSIVLEPASMTITGATPDGEVFIFGTQRARYAGAVTLVRDTQAFEFADSNGALVYTEDQDFEPAGTWLVIDLASGQSQMFRPNGGAFWEFDENSMPSEELLVGETELGPFNSNRVDVIALQDGVIGRSRISDHSSEDLEVESRRVKVALGDLAGLPGRSATLRGAAAAGDQYFVLDAKQRIAWHGCLPGSLASSEYGRDLAGGAR